MARKTKTAEIHPIHKRRVWDLTAGSTVVADGKLETVTGTMIDANDKGQPVVTLHFSTGRTVETRLWASAADGIPQADGSVQVVTMGRPGVGIYPWRMVEAERAFLSVHEHWTVEQYREALTAYVLERWPQG